MTKTDDDTTALLARIELAATALEIPREAVDHVIKHGTSRHRAKALDVLLAFAIDYGLSLDWLIMGDPGPMLRCASLWMKASRPKAA